MTTTTKQSNPPQANKQQLAELDALLQRMLRLPVNQLEETTAAGQKPAVVSSAPPAEEAKKSTPVASLQELGERMRKNAESSRAREQAAAKPATPAPVPANPMLPELLLARRLTPDWAANTAPATAPLPTAPLQTASTGNMVETSAQLGAVAAPAQPESSMEASSTPTFTVTVLRTLNTPYDRLTAPLGGLGTWLREGQGRDFVGWTGLFLVGFAVVWLLAGLGR